MSYNINEVLTELKELSIDTPQKPVLPSDDILNEYEKKIGFTFHADYRKFLKEASDVFVGVLSPLIVTENGNSFTELSNVLLEAKTTGLPENWLPICEDNGDYYCLLEDGSIHFWSHDGTTSECWDDLATWIKEVWINEG